MLHYEIKKKININWPTPTFKIHNLVIKPEALYKEKWWSIILGKLSAKEWMGGLTTKNDLN
jgi:hypothetical protein